MQYLPPFRRIADCFGPDANASVVRGLLSLLVRALLARDGLDVAWYLAEYPDVAEAIARSGTGDHGAYEHFCSHGYFEERRPRIFQVDEEWYRQHYRDVAADIRRGVIESAAVHYNRMGWLEGRAPRAAALDDVRRWNDLLSAYRTAGALL